MPSRCHALRLTIPTLQERVIQEIMENVRNDPRLELTLGGRVLPGTLSSTNSRRNLPCIH